MRFFADQQLSRQHLANIDHLPGSCERTDFSTLTCHDEVDAARRKEYSSWVSVGCGHEQEILSVRRYEVGVDSVSGCDCLVVGRTCNQVTYRRSSQIVDKRYPLIRGRVDLLVVWQS